jgi:hypothetical protein
MIGQHPELVGLPELKLFCFRTVGELEASLPSYWRERGFTHRSPGLVRALAQYKLAARRRNAWGESVFGLERRLAGRLLQTVFEAVECSMGRARQPVVAQRV